MTQRQLLKANHVWSGTYQTERTYNRAGGVISQKYPSQHLVTYNYDSAGRLADKDGLNLAFTGNLGDGVLRTYARGNTYSAWGSLSREQYGTSTNVYHKLRYNIRGQLCDVRASNVNDPMGGELGALVNYYSTAWSHCGSGTDNNGNVLMSQTIINSYYMEDRYSYDALNRLSAVNEYQNGATHTGSQQYDYDRYGSRKIKPASWGTGINTKQFDVDTNTNRLIVPAGQTGVMNYDAAGNLTNDTYTSFGSRTYDAENKMTSAQDSYAGWSYYTYNADGHRTRRKINNQETWQVYGFDGELLAEYAANAAAATPQKEYGYRNGQLLINATPGAGLVGHWKANENTGTTTADATGNGSTGTLASGAAWITGQSGSAVNLDGVNDYVQVGAQSKLVLTTAASFSAWLYPTGPGSDATHGGTILVKEGEYVIARYPNGTIRWGFANSNPGWAFVDTGYVAPLNQWTHIAITYDNGTIKTYANGSLVHTYSGSGSIGDAITGQNDFRIGGRQVISQHFQGRIDEVRVYNRALTATEVSALASGPASAVLAVNWLVADYLGTPRMIIDQTGTLANIKRHDYLPFGEELFAGAGGRSSANGYYGGDGVRQQFTSYERDNETGLDYAQARYYSSIAGRFTTVDPLMASGHTSSPQSWNRYTYSYNNPLRFTDPTGMLAGDFYDEDGKRLGTDGINDGNVYIVPDDKQAKQIKATDKAGGTTQVSAVSSALELPSYAVRQEIGVDAVARSNAPNATDPTGKRHEEGGVVIPTPNGQLAVPAQPGPVTDPLGNTPATINVTNAVNPLLFNQVSNPSANFETTYHVHPAGTGSVTTGTSRSGGGATVYGTETTRTGSFNQGPSPADFAAANTPTRLGYSIVVGARDQKVYLYNGSKVLAKMPLNKFVSIK